MDRDNAEMLLIDRMERAHACERFDAAAEIADLLELLWEGHPVSMIMDACPVVANTGMVRA